MSAAAQIRIARLAANLPVHRAFHWLHLHQPQLRLWQLEMLAIPAPPFGEQARARWFLDRFAQLGLANVHLDAEGNALAELPSENEETRRILLSAHLDTVFPATTPTIPIEEGTRILAPGACDNAAGLTALLAIAAALKFAQIAPPIPILFAANVGEEGEGDLRGMRHLFTAGPYRGRIVAALALEGAGTSAVVTRALGSRRFRVTLSGPGGHSWTDSAAPNPITLLSRCLTALADLPLPVTPRTTLSPGHIAGGTSINSIPSSASALLDLRSADAAQLAATASLLCRTVEDVVASANRRSPAQPPARLLIESIGDRPAGALPDDAPLLQTIRAVDRHLSLPTEPRMGSTDANLPLSLGIPAVALAAGGTGDGIHTAAEWYDPTGRESALRRILLVLLDAAQTPTSIY
jgi:tripeptide aminopeptidase